MSEPSRGTRSGLGVTIGLLVLLAVVTAFASRFGGIIGFASDSCFEGCDSARIEAAMQLAAIGPWVLLVVAVLASAMLLRTRRPAWPVPVVALALLPVPFVIALAVAESAAP